MNMPRFLSWLAIAGLLFYVFAGPAGLRHEPRVEVTADGAGATAVALAWERQASDVQVTGRGEVARILPDDNEGSRHQRFILRLSNGQTLLVAHNIDLAPRIAGLRVGDEVEFNGEYVWNRQGGVLHWTHHDPRGRHEAGWLKHDGRTYR